MTDIPLRFIERDGKRILQYKRKVHILRPKSSKDSLMVIPAFDRIEIEWIDVPLVEETLYE